MIDLLTTPLWTEDTLGLPLPASPHAVSVSLPCWQQVIGYEEGDAAIVGRLQAGYPRFFLPLVNAELHATLAGRHGQPGESCLAFPTQAAAERCASFVLQRHEVAGVRCVPLAGATAWAVFFPTAHLPTARLYWRFSGETLSSRQAASILAARTVDPGPGHAATRTLRARLAHLAGVAAGDVWLFPSGMAAVFAVHRMLLAQWPQRASVQLDFPYVDVLKVQEQFGPGVHFYPVVTEEALTSLAARAAAQTLSGVFCEAPSNPLLSCVPLARLSASLRPHGVPLVIDDTVATVVNVDALKYADVVTTSLTKSCSGAGDVLAGAVTLNPRSPHSAAFRAFLEADPMAQQGLWPEDAVVLEKNSRDFPKRARRASQNAAALVAFLRAHPAVERVYYPQLDAEGLQEILRPQGGCGCLLSFTLKDPGTAPAVYDALRVCKGPSLGTDFTLCCPYTLLAHYTELPWAASCGVPAHLLRVSTGLEETAELVARFQAALRA